MSARLRQTSASTEIWIACYQCVKRVPTLHALSSPPERSLYALSALNHQCWVHLKHSLMTWHGSLTNPQVSKQLLDTILHPRVQCRSSWRVIKMCRGIPLRDSNTSTMCLWTWTQASVCKYSAEHRVRMGVKLLLKQTRLLKSKIPTDLWTGVAKKNFTFEWFPLLPSSITSNYETVCGAFVDVMLTSVVADITLSRVHICMCWSSC